MIHDLKCWPTQFQPIWDGRKTFEFRREDRGFALGDTLRLHEWGPETGRYSGRSVDALVTYILPGGRGGFGVPDGHVVMAIRVEFRDQPEPDDSGERAFAHFGGPGDNELIPQPRKPSS